MSSPNTGLNQDPRAFRQERRNWKLRTLFALSRRPGPLRHWSIATVTVVIVIASVLWHRHHIAGAPAMPVVPYSDVAAAIAARSVSDIAIDDGGSRLVATLRTPRQVAGRPVGRVAAALPLRTASLDDLERWSASGAQVRVTGGAESPSPEFALQLVSLLAVVGIAGFIMLRQGRGGIGTRKFVATPTDRQLTLSDVGGAREAQADLRDVISYLKNPGRFKVMGARCPKGVLLIGPPGTGKTLLARAVAGEANCPVITAAGSDFNEMYVGVGSRRVRQLAKQARDAAPCIVFIDEFDSLGGRRGRRTARARKR